MDILFFDKRPMLLFCITILLGIYLATGENPLMPIILMVTFITGAFIGKTGLKYIITSLVLAGLFFGYGLLSEGNFDKAYSEYDGEECSVSATVVAVNSIKESYTLVTVRPKGFMKKKMKVYIMGNMFDLIQGDRLYLTGSLQKPSPATNPGGYDSRKVYYSDGIAAYVFADYKDTTVAGGFTFGQIFGLIRKDIQDTCIELTGVENGNILTAMLVGDKTGLDPDINDSFRESGLSHTMAVSGAHVAYILLPLMFIFKKLGLPRRKYYLWLITILVGFAALTGFQPSVSRAALTAGLMLAAGLLNQETDALNSLSLSAVILASFNPFAIYDAGFILSYVCVASIMIFYKPITNFTGKSPVMKVAAMTIAVQIGIIPVTAKLFYSIQLFSVISNLLIFPVRALLAILGWVMYLISNIAMPVSRLMAPVVGELVKSVSQVAGLFGGSVFSSVNIPYIPAYLTAIYFAAFYFALKMGKNRLVPAAIGIIAISAYMIFWAVPKDTYVFFDSGQADCFLVKTDKARDIVIDTGKYALGNPLAHFCGDYIDFIFLTHAHEDHIGGLEALLKRFRVGMVFIPGCSGAEMEQVVRMCENSKVPYKRLLSGMSITADGYKIEVLNPGNKDYLSLNDTSVVLKLTHGDTGLLYTGDIEIQAEIDILGSDCDLEADILKVPHHGAAGSAYSDFYEAVDAGIAVISCGENYYGHPSMESLELLSGSDVYRTDRDGAVIISNGKVGYKVTLCRQRITAD